MPKVRMPDGAVVDMPDDIDPVLAARLRAFQRSQGVSTPARVAEAEEIADAVPQQDGTYVTESGEIIAAPPPVDDNRNFLQKLLDDFTGSPHVEAAVNTVTGLPEAAMATGANMLVQAGAGLTAPLAVNPMDDNAMADYMRDFTASNSYVPYGQNARTVLDHVGGALAPIENAKESLGEGALGVSDSPGLATLAHMLPDLAMTVAGGPRAARAAPEIRTPKGTPGALADTTPKAPDAPHRMLEPDELSGGPPLPPSKSVSPVVDDLRAGGIELRPSDVRAMHPDAKSIPGEFRERFANPADLKKQQSLGNQATLTKRAADELGISDLTEKSFDAAEAPHTAVYEMAESVAGGAKVSPEFTAVYDEALKSAQLPKGAAHGTTRVIGALRRRANKRTSSGDVKTEEAGYADRELADRLEDEFGKQLESVGEPQLLQEYRDARKSLAKINDVRGATRADQIDASALRRMNERFGGGRLTGGLKFIADASEYAPNVTGHSLKTASRAGEEFPATKEGIFTRGAKALVRQIPGMDVGSKAFQTKLGPVDPARSSYYGQPEFVAPELPGPVQGGLDLRQVLGLEPPPGTVPRPPPARGPSGAQEDAFGSAFEFEQPPGEVAIPDRQIDLQEILGLGEPLNLQKPPGRVGKPKRKQ